MVFKQPIASTSKLSSLRQVKPRHTLLLTSEAGKPLSSTQPLRARRYSQNAGSILSSEQDEDPHCALFPENSHTSSLGLRIARPPDRFQNPSRYALPTPPSRLQFSEHSPKSPKNCESEEVPDNEWELRTGRAIYVLQETLPHFFETGLITQVDVTTGEPKPPSQHFHIPLIDSATSLDFLSPSSSTAGSSNGGNSHHRDHGDSQGSNVEDGEPIYSPRVRLQYTPPVTLPAPFPKTFHLEGLPMYLASSSVVRRTMMTLYSNLEVTLTKMSVFTEPPPGSKPPSGGGADSVSASALITEAPTRKDYVLARSNEGSGLERTGSDDEGPPPPGNGLDKGRKRVIGRQKYLVVRQLVTGLNRVSGKVGEWEVESTYTFSPISGLILQHTVNSIQPAPHLAVYDLLKGSLGHVFGFGGSPAAGGGVRS